MEPKRTQFTPEAEELLNALQKTLDGVKSFEATIKHVLVSKTGDGETRREEEITIRFKRPTSFFVQQSMVAEGAKIPMITVGCGEERAFVFYNQHGIYGIEEGIAKPPGPRDRTPVALDHVRHIPVLRGLLFQTGSASNFPPAGGDVSVRDPVKIDGELCSHLVGSFVMPGSTSRTSVEFFVRQSSGTLRRVLETMSSDGSGTTDTWDVTSERVDPELDKGSFEWTPPEGAKVDPSLTTPRRRSR